MYFSVPGHKMGSSSKSREGEYKMLYKNLKLRLFGAIGRIRTAGILLAGVAAIVFTIPSPVPAYAEAITPPVPGNIQVPTGNKLFLVGHAVGTQNYICVPSGTGVKFVL